MNEKEFISYLKEFRINEFTDAKDWLLNAVHRDRKRTLSNMQKIIFNSGFELLYWNTEHSPPQYLNDLTPKIINRCLKNNDFLSFNDLITTSIYFIARKL